MTTKIKIIGGFVVMVILIGLLAVVGYRSTQQAANGFENFQEMAGFNVATSNLVTELYHSSTSVYTFANTKNEKEMDNARAAITRALEDLEIALSAARKDTTKQKLTGLKTDVANFSEILNQIQTGILESDRIYNTSVQANLEKVMSGLRDLAKAAVEVQNTVVLFSITQVWDDLSTVRSSLSRFAQSQDPADATIVAKNIAEIETALQELSRNLQTEGGRRIYNDIHNTFAVLQKDFNTLNEQSQATAELFISFNKTLTEKVSIAN